MGLIDHKGSQGGALYQRCLLLAAGAATRGDRGKRYVVWMEPKDAAGRGIPEHDPRHNQAVQEAQARGTHRWVDASGTEWSVREDS